APLVANNLAWALAFSEPADLSRALELAETALQRAPGEARFRSTRGQILAKLGRYKEARPDLEEGLKVYGTDAKLLMTLSDTCARLGDAKQAAEYKKKADEAAAQEKNKPPGGK